MDDERAYFAALDFTTDNTLEERSIYHHVLWCLKWNTHTRHRQTGERVGIATHWIEFKVWPWSKPHRFTFTQWGIGESQFSKKGIDR